MGGQTIVNREREEARSRLRDKGSRFLDYLSALAREQGSKPQQQIEKSLAHILSTQLPDVPELFVIGPNAKSNAWFTMRQAPKPAPVSIPESLKPYIEPRSVKKTTSRPKLGAKFKTLKEQAADKTLTKTERFEISERITQISHAFAQWNSTTWVQWCSTSKLPEQAYDLYQKLFSMYLQVSNESDTTEMVFGHAILTWSGRRKVDYPLVLTTVHMVFREDSGMIQIIPEGDPRMSTAPWESTDLFGFRTLAELQSRFNSNPIDLWDQAEYREFESRIVTSLGSNARINDGIDLMADDEPRLQRGWVLMLRNRADNRDLFYRKLSEKLQNSDQLPVAFDALFSDMKTIRTALGDAPEDDGTADRLLMPLPANDEQKRIIRQLAKSAGVTVQGPPGTGKSHTIVNLISHLLAQGKRILVTAEKEQALSVLQNKLPENIRDLAVASIGTSVADTDGLRLSVQRMQDSLSELDPVKVKERITRLSHQMDSCETEIAQIDTRLKKALASETSSYETMDGTMSAANVAKWVVRNSEYDIIPDTIEPEVGMPLTIEEFAEFVELSASLDDADIEASRQVLPDDSLPQGGYLADAYSELKDVQTKIATLKNSGLDMRTVDSVPEKETKRTLQTCRNALDRLRAIDGDWERELGSLVRDNHQQREWLRDSVKKLSDETAKCMELAKSCRDHDIAIPEGNPATQTEWLRQWSDRLAQGKGLPRIFNKELRAFASTVMVDGYQPDTTDKLDLVGTFVKERAELARLNTLVRKTFEGTPVPFGKIDENALPSLADRADKVISLIDWWSDDAPEISGMLRPFFRRVDPVRNAEVLENCVDTLDGYVFRHRETEIQEMLDEVEAICEHHISLHHSGLWNKLSEDLRKHDMKSWQKTLDEASRLAKVRCRADRRDELGKRLATVAPKWTEAIFSTRGKAAGVPDEYPRFWAVAQTHSWVKDVTASANMEELIDESFKLNDKLHKTVSELINWSARLHLKEVQDPDDRKALNTWLDAIKKYGKGTGKNAGRYLSTARHELPKAMNSMPVWIMPLHRVLENFDPTVSHPFDVIIVDESSQCNILSVGVLALANKAVIVGDDKQTSPSGAFQSLDKINKLQEQYIPDFADKSLFDMKDSLYAMANRTFPSTIMLREHFRCVPEIIEYSNRFYDGQIFPLREKTHPEIGSPLIARHVENAEIEKKGNDSINLAEAEAIAKQIAACCEDSRYDGLTFGVVTMMSGQQRDVINDMLIDAIGMEEYTKRRLRVGNPPDFQGDERNVIFLSFVTNSNSYAATQQTHAQWANVAASRAQDQLWAFYSVDPSSLSENDYRRGLIEYVRDYGTENEQNEDGPSPTEAKTDFEKDVFEVLCELGYRKETFFHYQVGRYWIDYVVDMGHGCRVALECDGDRNPDPEADKTDIEKQRILERLGWRFIRLGSPDFYLNPDNVKKMLRERLNSLREAAQSMEEMLKDAAKEAPHADNPTPEEDDSSESESEASIKGKDSESSDPLQTEAMSENPREEEDLRDVATDITSTSVDEDAEDVTESGAVEKTDSHAGPIEPQEESDEPITIHGFIVDELVSQSEMPVKGTQGTAGEWVSSILMMLIPNEFPLNSDLMRKQVSDFIGANMSEDECRRTISDALTGLEYEGVIRREADGYYYPTAEDIAFRICRGRQISFISTIELASVMRLVCSENPGKPKSMLFDEVLSLYGFFNLNKSIERGFDKAFDLLTELQLLKVEKRHVYPEGTIADTPSHPFGTILKAMKDRQRSQSYTTAVETDDSHISHVIDLPPKNQTENDASMQERTSIAKKADESEHSDQAIRRQFTTYGEKYGLTYAEPVDVRALPNRSHYTSDAEWLRASVILLVSQEYPLVFGMLRKQMSVPMAQQGIKEHQIEELLRKTIRDSENFIVNRKDVLLPIDRRVHPFRIIRHREIGFISKIEIAMVMKRIIRAHPGCDKNFLFDEAYLIYGFRSFGNKIHDAFEEAIHGLLRAKRVSVSGGGLYIVK